MGKASVSPGGMVYAIVMLFVIGALGTALTSTLNQRFTYWAANLTGTNAPAGVVIGLVPLIFWIILAAGLILGTIHMFLGGGSKRGGL